MDSNVQTLAWKNYRKRCEWLRYEPEETVETNILQRYNTLYTRYCQDNRLQFDPSTNLDSDVAEQKLSELLYRNLCQELGFESIIQIRRNIPNLLEQIRNQINSGKTLLMYHVGSMADGFRISTSDLDCMLVNTEYLVVNNTTEIPELSCVKLNKHVLTMETKYTKPGYVRLILETDKSILSEIMSISGHNDIRYLSSSLYRKFMVSTLGRNVERHGPATTFKSCVTEFDLAPCLPCRSQPSAVENWVKRCNEYNWPDSVVLKQCISLGCQLAPVGSKQSLDENLEWRISFILMEKTLLKSLSHSQFMCYGLLKVYLKEVLGSFGGINDLVSSYVIKTVLLWEIQTNSQHNVGADSLLQLFWSCLQRLYKCVKTGYCHNFFIPENNMFENRIYGENQCTLQNILESLFTERFYGLYRCQSIDLPCLIFQVLMNEKQSVVVSVNESIYVTNEDIEAYACFEINAQFHYFKRSTGGIEELDTLRKILELMLTKDSLTDLEKMAVQTWISKLTVDITTHNFKDIIAPSASPDIALEKYNSCCKIIRTHYQKGSVAPLYLATLMYITGRYHSCLDCIKKCITRNNKLFLSIFHVSVYLQLTELRLELEFPFKMGIVDTKRTALRIHPMLYSLMLTVLCHYHLGDVDETEMKFQVLREFRTGNTFDFEMSWQVLGICTEIIGKYDEAYQSYMLAYMSPRLCLEGNAPLLRMLCLIYKRLPK